MYLADVARRVILVVLFDNRTTLGLVRLKMKQTVDELTQAVRAGVRSARRKRRAARPASSPARTTRSTSCSSKRRRQPCR